VKEFDLALVMPVYNEKDCIAGVVQSWDEVLTSLNIRYQILVYNDGSKDNTLQVLQGFNNSLTIKVIDKPNAGHGPTILLGYKQAVPLAAWVFQCDSDGEMMPGSFPALWAKRDEYDALFGYRENRVQSQSRAFISAASRFAVKTFFGAGIRDVNTPYRLIRAAILADMVETIPSNTFAPNVLISGELCRRKCRIFNAPVPHLQRRTGQSSVVGWKLWKAVIKSFFQTIRYTLERRGR